MRTTTKEFTLYKFDELTKKAQERAINNEVEFWIMLENSGDTDLPPFVTKAVKEAERMHTPWFFGQIIWDEGQKEILQSLRDQEYLASGEVWIE